MRLAGLILVSIAMLAGPAAAERRIAGLDAARLAEIFPGAGRVGAVTGPPPAAAVYKAGRLAGYVFSTQAVVQSTGYSGKPLDILVGLGLDARLTGARLVAHQEPILVIGVRESDLTDFVAGFAGLDIREIVRVGESKGLDAISGATVSSVVIGDSILRAARIVARAKGIIAPLGGAKRLDIDSFKPLSWSGLVAIKAFARLRVTNGEIEARLPGAGAGADADRTFFELYAALLTPAMIGRNLLGDRDYNRLMAERRPGEQVVFLAANGRWSFKGTGWVRTGIFDRLQIVQGENTFRPVKAQHRRLDRLRAEGAPEFREMALFVLPAKPAIDPAAPWRVEVLVSRKQEGTTRRATLVLTWRPPPTLLATHRVAEPDERDFLGQAMRAASGSLWLDQWRRRAGRIVVLALALVALTAILFLQDAIARRPKLYLALRNGFLAFTIVWIGWYAGAQLSVINVLTFSQALLTGFHWELFLLEPLIFILWGYVAVAMLFWGRGVFCGWLCPFGALQELLNHIARWLKLPQLAMPFGLHERLWPIKYILFLGLFALSLGSMALAVFAAEVEPFKTVFALNFARQWPFVLFAAVLLGAGLFVERFYCRYLCPLGGALAIPARLRMFDWLKRRPECGAVCQACAVECTVQAIHPDGRINPNECIHCLNCQVLYFDDHRCPPLIERRKRRARRAAGTSWEMQPAGKAGIGEVRK